MWFKLLIIIGVIVLGATIFSSQISDMFPAATNTIDSIKDDVTGLGSETFDTVEKQIDSTVAEIIDYDLSSNPVDAIKDIFSNTEEP